MERERLPVTRSGGARLECRPRRRANKQRLQPQVFVHWALLAGKDKQPAESTRAEHGGTGQPRPAVLGSGNRLLRGAELALAGEPLRPPIAPPARPPPAPTTPLAGSRCECLGCSPTAWRRFASAHARCPCAPLPQRCTRASAACCVFSRGTPTATRIVPPSPRLASVRMRQWRWTARCSLLAWNALSGAVSVPLYHNCLGRGKAGRLWRASHPSASMVVLHVPRHSSTSALLRCPAGPKPAERNLSRSASLRQRARQPSSAVLPPACCSSCAGCPRRGACALRVTPGAPSTWRGGRPARAGRRRARRSRQERAHCCGLWPGSQTGPAWC